MLVYCFEPVGLSFEDAMPAFLRVLNDERALQTLSRGARDGLSSPLGEMGSKLSICAVSVGKVTQESGRVAIPIECSTEDPSLISSAGEITLSRLGSTLCHLSLNSSLAGRLATGLMFNRSFQMAVELAAAEFLYKLARAVTALAQSDSRPRGSCPA
jgi:hypothetical protein